MHVRQQLRQAIFNRISNDAAVLTLVPVENIFIERIKPLQPQNIHSDGPASQFPLINIIANDDSTDQGFINPCGKYEVEQQVDIEVYTEGADNYGAAIDEIVAAVQTALHNNLKLDLDILGVKYERSRMSVDLTESIFAGRILTYNYQYRVNYASPDQFA